MVKLFFHTLRCVRLILKGKLCDRPLALKSYVRSMERKGAEPQRVGDGVLGGAERRDTLFCDDRKGILLPINCETKLKFYIGLRLVDSSMCVTQMRYLELFELGRWHHMGVTDIGGRSVQGKVLPLVASVNIQYLTELGAFQTVVIRTRMVGVCGKNLVHIQQIESVDGTTVFAVGTVRLSWVRKEKASLVSKFLPGALEIEDVLVRLGCTQADIDEINSKPFPVVDDSTQSNATMQTFDNRYWGRKVSSYDSFDGGVSSSAFVSLPSLCRVYTSPLFDVMNEADKLWRDDVSTSAKERKHRIRGRSSVDDV